MRIPALGTFSLQLGNGRTNRRVNRVWRYKETAVKELSQELLDVAGGIPLLAKLLAIRGITDPQDVKAFLNLSDYQPTSGLAFPGMEKAVTRIQEAIESKAHILVYGDFDVDGITGTSVLMQCLKSLNATVSYYVPDRHTEGHGLNTTALCRLVSTRQVKLVITTDTGSTNFNEVNLLNGLKVDTIITDHHELPEHLPQALAVLNPKLLPEDSPLAYLSGVGVAYKLCEVLLDAMGAPQSQKDALLDLVAIGTVVDMVPLLRENRYLVWLGLQVLNRRERVGLNALLFEANVNETAPINTQTLGFTIGPRLNAIGRLANANDGVTILTTRDKDEARQLAAKLEQLNRQRKELVEQCLLQAETHLMRTGELTDQKAIILSSKDWNPGVVGLVATKLIDKFHRPCFIGYIDEETEEIRFSARSIEGFNMHENLLELEDLFIRWGGHSGAAGFAIAKKDLQRLKTRLFQLCSERIQDQQLIPVTWVDLSLASSQVNPFLVEIVDKMAPFGQSNPMPIFGFENVSVGAQRFIGEDQRHLKLILNSSEPGQYLEALYWNWGSERPKLNPAEKYSFAFTVELNTYNGATKVQLIVKDYLDESRQNVEKLHEAPISKASKVSMALPGTQNTDNTANQPARENLAPQGRFQWVDHRGRDEIESFLNQTIIPSAGQRGADGYRVFCEGTQQNLPIPMTTVDFCGRNGGKPEDLSHHLVLWDLPPDIQSLLQLLQVQEPKIIHLVGGKYEKIPLYRPPQQFLQGFYKILQRLSTQNKLEPVVITFSKLAMMLSTSYQAVVTGLSLLSRLGLVSISILSEQDTVKIALMSEMTGEFPNINEMIEYIAFRSSLQEVYQFREWLMSAPLNVIQSTVDLETVSGSTVLKEERERHAINLH